MWEDIPPGHQKKVFGRDQVGKRKITTQTFETTRALRTGGTNAQQQPLACTKDF